MRNVKELLDLSGQVAIVTGGASGLGRQMAYALGEAGANLVIAARKVERCERVAKEMEADLGVRVVPAALDITKPEMIEEFYEMVKKEFGRVDILINNSGTMWSAHAEDFPLDGWNKVIETNLTGAFLMAKYAGKMMIEQKYGRIINVASYLAFVGQEYMEALPYPTTKAALLGLTRDLAAQWAKYNITVNCIAPGWFPSDLSGYLPEQFMKMILKRVPMRRIGSDDELKTGILFLASPGSSYCTGTTLCIDGGTLAV